MWPIFFEFFKACSFPNFKLILSVAKIDIRLFFESEEIFFNSLWSYFENKTTIFSYN